MGELSESEFHATFTAQMIRARDDEEPPFDFWPYFDTIPHRDFQGFDCAAGKVESVYRDSNGRLEHVLVNSNDKNVFMVLVLDRGTSTVLGHRLLNLRKEYGLDEHSGGAA